MLSIFKYLYTVGVYIEKEYNESIGKKIKSMSLSTVPIKIHDFINERFKKNINIPNAAAELYFYIRSTQEEDE